MDLKVNVGATVGPFDEKYRFWTGNVSRLAQGGTGVTTRGPGHGTKTPTSGDKNTGVKFAVDLFLLCAVLIASVLFLS